jgi:hypothetical protein
MISGPPLNEAHVNESISKLQRLLKEIAGHLKSGTKTDARKAVAKLGARLGGFDQGPHDPGSPVALLDRQMREPSPGLSSKVAALRKRLIEMSTFRVYRYDSTTIIVDHGATSHLKEHTRTRLRRRGLTRAKRDLSWSVRSASTITPSSQQP